MLFLLNLRFLIVMHHALHILEAPAWISSLNEALK